MIDIPHLPPVRFAKEVKKVVDDDCIVVSCEFNGIAQIAELTEAAAQASAGFSEEKNQKGFLIQVRDACITADIESSKLDVMLRVLVNTGKTAQFEFLFFHEHTPGAKPVAGGLFTVYKE
ncbi:MAG: hypothetical protein ACQERK_03200 [Campylobacterota bacterium]